MNRVELPMATAEVEEHQPPPDSQPVAPLTHPPEPTLVNVAPRARLERLSEADTMSSTESRSFEEDSATPFGEASPQKSYS
nr:hypothetical protein BaRGS_003896 [Batillaria attramentaria]